jgi:hypothetical protein
MHFSDSNSPKDPDFTPRKPSFGLSSGENEPQEEFFRT